MKKVIFPVLFAGLAVNVSFSQTISFNDFKNIEHICYCNTTSSTPNSILEMDNNWELVLALIQQKSASQLDSSGIKYTLSQLKLLEDWLIISKSDDEIYKTEIPVLDSIKTAKLREYSIISSKKLSEIISNDVVKLRDLLRNSRREKNIYTILFSYVLDGMVWDLLDADSLLPNYEISVKKPFWAGEFWLLYPKRNFSCGTNSISDKGYSIKVNWSEPVIPYMLPFVSRWDLLGKILNDLISSGKVNDKESIEVFGKYNMFDNEGNFTVPFIIENESNAIYKLSGEISGKVKSFLTTNIDTAYLNKEFSFKSNGQAIIITYHEMLWDILEILESNGLIEKPFVFIDPEKSLPADISDLIIITKKTPVENK